MEQSKQLLEIGIPASTADCYYGAIGFGNGYDKLPNLCGGAQFLGTIDMPCWSTGRLIEIFNIVTPKQERFLFWMNITKYKILNYTGVFVEALQELKDHDALDLSKLEL